MENDCRIKNIEAMEILDSRGDPTVYARVVLADGTNGSAAVPSGASTGTFEAAELRDRNMDRYNGKGVLQAVNNISSVISPGLRGMKVTDQSAVDHAMLDMDGTKNKSFLGANAILAVSLASAKAAAAFLGLPLYRHISGSSAFTLPVPMMNILNGGAHASNNIDIQEFLIMPAGAPSFDEAVRWCSEVFHSLKKVLADHKLSTAVGDEGGFAPDLEDDEEALKAITAAVENAGYVPGRDIFIAMDPASSEWYRHDSKYILPKKQKEFSSDDLIRFWENVSAKYPVISIEDGLAEDDWDGWTALTKTLGDRIQLTGDDLFVTSVSRLKKGIQLDAANSILVKPNQIGTLTETLDAIFLAKKAGYTTVISHRSGETEDTAIADLAVSADSGQIKAGAPSRGERTAKYNRLLLINRELGDSAVYKGMDAFSSLQGKKGNV